MASTALRTLNPCNYNNQSINLILLQCGNVRGVLFTNTLVNTYLIIIYVIMALSYWIQSIHLKSLPSMWLYTYGNLSVC